jgi:hypothetical protein
LRPELRRRHTNRLAEGPGKIRLRREAGRKCDLADLNLVIVQPHFRKLQAREADELMRRHSGRKPETARKMGSTHAGDLRELRHGQIGIEILADEVRDTLEPARLQRLVGAAKRWRAKVDGGISVHEMRGQREPERFHQEPPGRAFMIELAEDLARDLADERVLRDGLVTQFDPLGIDVEVAQHGFVEGLAGQEDVQTFLDGLLDVDELLGDPGQSQTVPGRPWVTCRIPLPMRSTRLLPVRRTATSVSRGVSDGNSPASCDQRSARRLDQRLAFEV